MKLEKNKIKNKDTKVYLNILYILYILQVAYLDTSFLVIYLQLMSE